MGKSFINRAFKKSAMLVTFGILALLSGCRVGFDPTAVDLVGRVIDYHEQLAKLPKPALVNTFGRLSPKAGVDSTGVSLESEYKQALKNVDEIRKLPDRYSFDESEKVGILLWFKNTMDELKKIEGDLGVESLDSAQAFGLATKVTDWVKTDGILVTNRPLVLRDSWPAQSKVDGQKSHNALLASLEHLYQTSLLLALTIKQQDVSMAIEDITDGLIKLSGLAKDFTTEGLLTKFNAAVAKINAQIAALDTAVSDIVSESLVFTGIKGLTDSLAASIGELNGLFVGIDAADQAAVQSANQAIQDASAKLILAINSYEQIEGLKNPQDVQLKELVKKAFVSNMASVVGVKLDKTTDINDLVKALTGNDAVILRADSGSLNLVYALVSSIESNVAQGFGLTDSIKVIGPDHDRLTRDKFDYSISNSQYDELLRSTGQKLREQGKKDGSHKSIYVVFADHYPQGSKVSYMVNQLKKNGGKVLIIASDPSAFTGKLFVPRGLNATEAFLLANEILKSEILASTERLLVSDRIARLFAAFGEMKIANFGPVVEDVAARLRQRPTKNDKKIQMEIIQALASIGVKIGEPSVALKDSLATIQNNLAKNPNFYRAAAGN